MSPTRVQVWQKALVWLLLPLHVLSKQNPLYNTALQPTKPHIVFILVDDWGWADVGYHRDPPTKEVSTPNIDGLVKDGLELDQHYAYRFCSPSRSSFISGRLPIHVNDVNLDIGHYNPNDTVSGFAGIPRNMTGIAEKMKEGGYTAHQVGKWHAGGATPDHIPTGRGFESSLGYLNGYNDYYTEIFRRCSDTDLVDLWDTNKPGTGMNGTDYEEELFTKWLFHILDNYDTSKPLFLYYAPHLVHAPLEVPQRYIDKFKFIDDKSRQIYHAMVKYLDDVIGNVTKTLKNKEMWDNTLFVLSSDNGGPISPQDGANNYPLKGGKYSDWQGGVRVNAFVSGGYLPEKMRGQKTDGYIHLADWYATFCALAGVDPTDEKAAKAKLPPIDSLNMWPLISGQNDTSPRLDIPLSTNALISGDYKIITGDISLSIWTGPQFPNKTTTSKSLKITTNCKNGCLYNIKDDPLEHDNIAMKMSNTVKEMLSKLAAYQQSYFNPDRGKESVESCNTALKKYGGFWGPFLP